MRNPSVTQVLGKYQDFSRIPSETLEAAAERGKEVHRFCAGYARGLWFPAPKALHGYCESFRRWYLTAVDTTVGVEIEMVDDLYGYIGHCDWIGVLKGDKKPTLADWKTPATKSPVWGAQLAAYLNLAKRAYDVERVITVQLHRDGGLPTVTEYTDSARDLQAFLNALAAHKYFLGG